MDNKEYLLKRLNQYKTESERGIFVNQQLTYCYMNGDTKDWVTIFSCAETNKLINIGFKNGANFEFAFTNSSQDSDIKFNHLLLWLERAGQINLVNSNNVNNCLLSATLTYKDLNKPLSNIHKNLNAIYENHILKSKIDIFFSDNAIFLNLSNMKNIYMIDFLIKNHHQEILVNDKLHQMLKENQREKFSSYLRNESLSYTLKDENKSNMKKIKI